MILALLASISLGFAQLESNSITVTTSHSAQLDQAVYTVQVNSGLNASLDDALAALRGAGVTMANFLGLNSFFAIPAQPVPGPLLAWTFRFAVPLAKMKDTITLLNSLQQNLANRGTGLTIAFALQGTQASGQSCAVSDLIADARAQAQKLADGGGVTVGNILAISSPTGTSSANSIQAAVLGASSPPPSGPPVCAVTVKFALLRL